MLYTPITCTKIIDQNFVWDEFETFYVLITSSQQLESYAFETYCDLSYFFNSWAKYNMFKFVPLVGLNWTPPMCWRLGSKGSKS